MATKKVESNSIEIDGETYETTSVDYRGAEYVLRELSVTENDDIETAATDKDGKFNGRLNLRLSLATSIVSPPTTADQIGKWGGKKYVLMSRAFNKLNTISDETSALTAVRVAILRLKPGDLTQAQIDDLLAASSPNA